VYLEENKSERKPYLRYYEVMKDVLVGGTTMNTEKNALLHRSPGVAALAATTFSGDDASVKLASLYPSLPYHLLPTLQLTAEVVAGRRAFIPLLREDPTATIFVPEFFKTWLDKPAFSTQLNTSSNHDNHDLF
jgi:hypothetical protein